MSAPRDRWHWWNVIVMLVSSCPPIVQVVMTVWCSQIDSEILWLRPKTSELKLFINKACSALFRLDAALAAAWIWSCHSSHSSALQLSLSSTNCPCSWRWNSWRGWHLAALLSIFLAFHRLSKNLMFCLILLLPCFNSNFRRSQQYYIRIIILWMLNNR